MRRHRNHLEVRQPELGRRLRSRRLERGLSQEALAGDAMTASYISLIERGRRVPTLDVVIRLARLLDTTLPDLVGHQVQGLTPAVTGGPSAFDTRLQIRHLTADGELDSIRGALAERLAAARAQQDDEAALDVGLALREVLLAGGTLAERLALLEELAALPPVQQAPAVRLSLTVERASVLRELGRVGDARKAAQAATNMLTEPPEPSTPDRVRTLGVLTSVLSELGELDRVEEIIADMLAAATATEQPGVLGRAHWVASMALSRMGRPDAAYDHLALARDALVYETMPVRDLLRFCRFAASILIDADRDLDQARQWIETAEATAEMTGLAAEKYAARRERARYELAAGDPQVAAELFGELVDGSAASDAEVVGSDQVVALAGLGEALARSGQVAEAIAQLRRAAEEYEENGNYRKATETWRRIDRLHEPPGAGPG